MIIFKNFIRFFAMLRFWFLVFSLGLPLAALAHDLWFERAGDVYTLQQGHRHSAHASAETAPYEAAKLRDLRCLADDGNIRSLSAGKASPVRVAAGSCAAIAAVHVSGYWTKTAWETRNVPKTGIAGVLKSWCSEEAIKRIDKWSPATAKPMTAGLELTPQSNPLAAKVGDKVVVQVTDAGRPLAGIPVAYGGETRGVTGEDGKVAIRLRQAGVQLISASVETPRDDGNADLTVRSATLQFEVAR